MRKAQVFLRDDQTEALRSLSRQTGRKQSELIRRGVDLAIAEAGKAEPPSADWRKAWTAAAGMWADRGDLGELDRDMRRSGRLDRFEKQWQGE